MARVNSVFPEQLKIKRMATGNKAEGLKSPWITHVGPEVKNISNGQMTFVTREADRLGKRQWLHLDEGA